MAIPSRLLRAPAAWLTVGFLLLQVAWIITVPPFRGSDEFDHAYRAAAVARGQWVTQESTVEGRGLLVTVPPDLVTAAHEQCAALSYTGPDNCSSAGDAGRGLVRVGSGAGAYHPAFYWVVGTVARPFEGAGSLYAMRIATALSCALWVCAAAWSATRAERGAWPLAGLLIAMSPVLVYSTSIVAPNGVELTAALALWSSLLGLARGAEARWEARLIGVAIGAAAAMCTLRLLGPLFVVLAVTAVAALEPRRLYDVVRRHRLLVGGGTLIVVAAALEFLWWVLGPGHVDIQTPQAFGRENLVDATFDPFTYALLWNAQAIAAFPLRDIPAPAAVYVLEGVLALTLVVLGLRARAGARRWVLVAAIAATLLIPLAATVVSLDSRGGVIWQGRYGLPFNVGVLMIAAGAVATSPRWRLSRSAVWGIAVVTTVASVVSIVHVRSDELGRPASAEDPSWWAPPVLLLVALLIASGAASARALSLMVSGERREEALPCPSRRIG